jgi:collagenase-like PrtC family protease
MNKPELLVPAGDIDCLRAAITNGANAVYLGLEDFNARRKAKNFTKENIKSVIKHCHKHNIKVYVTLNILIKNSEIEKYLQNIEILSDARVDAIIIQDINLIPTIKKYFPKLTIHLSTQSTITNSSMIPKEVDRVILSRELNFDQVKEISKTHNTEMFVHGALCISYSGQCLFSSIAGARSANRGLCAGPCRKKYNNKYLLSTKDLCLIEKLPEIAQANIKSIKIEGRMRSPLYVSIVTKIYRKYLDQLNDWKTVSPKDIDDLKMAFNRDFTTGFSFNDTITNIYSPSNKGLFLGKVVDGKLKLRHNLSVNDGIEIKQDNESNGKTIKTIRVNNVNKKNAFKGETIDLDNVKTNSFIYKTSQANLKLNLGEEISLNNETIKVKNYKFKFKEEEFSETKFIVNAHNKNSAIEADMEDADIIYLDIEEPDFKNFKNKIFNSKLFAKTPRILSEENIPIIINKIKEIEPDGLLIRNRGLLKEIDKLVKSDLIKPENIHFDYSFNTFNDLDLEFLNKKYPKSIPIISPELSFRELSEFSNKKFISLIHGNIILMTLKEKLKAPELIDESNRHFKVYQENDTTFIQNSNQLGLFNMVRKLKNMNINYYLIDSNKDVEKIIRIYKQILNKDFDDRKIKKKYTTGNYFKTIP